MHKYPTDPLCHDTRESDHTVRPGVGARPTANVLRAAAGATQPSGRPCGHRMAVVLILVLVLTLISGCGAGEMIPNPFAAEEPTPVPPAATRPVPTQIAATPTMSLTEQLTPTFTPFWVKNHRLTEMWSGPTDAPGTVSFGTTSSQFCSFLVVLPPDGPRLYVFNPHSQNYLWMDADAIGPVGPPEQRAGSPPSGQNCSEAVFTE